MSRSQYEVARLESQRVFIIDKCLPGALSVTNDAENVVSDVLKIFGELRIVYRDSQGSWDELLHDGVKFTGFAPYGDPLPPSLRYYMNQQTPKGQK